MKQLNKKQLPARGVHRTDVHREIQLLGSVQHENIIRLYETFEDNDSIYMAVEYCDGGDFGDKVLERGDAITEFELAGWSEQMISAIAFMHTRSICHRDIKPDNFLVARSSRLKLADLGLAVECPPGKPLTEKCGTPAFMSPELYNLPRRSRGYGLPADIWAAGVTMYMVMFGGKHPFLNARGSLNEKSMLSGELDFRKGGFLGSLGLGGSHMSDEARQTCQLMVDIDPQRRISGKSLLERSWFVQAQSDPSSGGTSMGHTRTGDSTRGLRDIKERVQRKLERLPTKLEEVVTKRLSSRFVEDNVEPPADNPALTRDKMDTPSWEFGVRDGYCSYQADSSVVLEEQYQAYVSGSGPPQGEVVSMGRKIVVDFKGMTQQVKGSTGRMRAVRRTDAS